MRINFIFIFAFCVVVQTVNAFQSVQEGVFVQDAEKKHLKILAQDPLLTVDHVSRDGFEVYGPKSLREILFLRGVPFQEFKKMRAFEIPAYTYPTFDEYEATLKGIHAKYSKITKLFSIGKSVEGRDLWVMKISDQPEKNQVEPEVKLISSMHGDEIAGREVLVLFLKNFLESYEKGEKEVQALINHTEIFIMPSMNPDGSMAQTRANGNGADLNRDFPDFSTTDNLDSLENRQPETQAIMKFQASRKFALSANFHGGAEVVNYMWDTEEAAHPFEPLLKSIAKKYASQVPYMKSSMEFQDGITNGYAWYEVNGGMQDWSYYWYGDTQFTIEISDQKWPLYSQMDKYYKENRDAIFSFLAGVHQGAGFKFAKKDEAGMVTISQITDAGTTKSLGTFPFSNSEYFKILEPGDYSFTLLMKDSGSIRAFKTTVVANKIYSHGNYKILE